MNTPSRPLPKRFNSIAGPLPAPGAVPVAEASPFETVQPAHQGFVEQGGVKLWYAVWGNSGPWLAFAPPFQIVHSELFKGAVPYLSRHFRVITTDGRGNGRSDRPTGQDAYSFDHFYADFVAALDAVGAERVALVGLSAAALTVLRLAAEQPQRVTHVITAGGFAESMPTEEKRARWEKEGDLLRSDWPAYIDQFMQVIFSEPHSTKPYEDGVHYGWATNAEWMGWCRNAWRGNDVREQARRVSCPTLVIHGDGDQRVPYAMGREIHELVPGSKMLTIAGGGHVTPARDPVQFNQAVRDFVAGAPRKRTWVRAIKRPRRALFISSPIGLGHVQTAARSGYRLVHRGPRRALP